MTDETVLIAREVQTLPAIRPKGPERVNGKIARAGVYRISADEYHSDCCVGPSVSRSALWKIGVRGSGDLKHRSPAHFYDSWCGNPSRTPDETTKALDFGRCAHLLVTNEGRYEKEFIVAEYVEFRSNEAKAWKAAQLASGKTVISQKDSDVIVGMAAAMARDRAVQRIFKYGEGEVSYIYQDHITGIWVKTRPDWTPPAPAPVYDYKTCDDGSPGGFDRKAFSYGYHLQAAMVLEAIQATMNDSRIGFINIAQEKTAPYVVSLIAMEPDQIKHGAAILRKSLDTMARCIEKNKWPGYSDGARALVTPGYVAHDADALVAEVFK